MSKKVSGKSYLTPNQVAELLMVSPTTVRQWAEKGELNALTTPGGHRRFLLGEIERFARKRGMTLNSSDDDSLRILIVDDDKQFVRYLTKLLNGVQEKIVVDTANDGFIAGFKIREFEPHVVMLDLMMPGLNGFEVCRLMQSEPNTKSIRVIAITGNPSSKNIEKILAAGAEVCLPKPIDTQMLFEHLGLNQSKRT